MKTSVLLVLVVLSFSACSSALSASRESPAAGIYTLPGRGPDSEGGSESRPPSPGYRIIKEGRHNHENWLGLNEYFLIHHLYNDIFQRFGMRQRFGLPDKISIFSGLLHNLDFEKPVTLMIDDFKDSAALVVSLQLIRIGGQTSVLLATNTDREGNRIYVGVEYLAKTYKRSYLIVDNQLIAAADLFSESREAELIEENQANDLARFYIFDGNTGNDTVAEGLLIGSIREARSVSERSLAELILCRYYISRNRLPEAQALLEAVDNQLARVGGQESLLENYSITYEELLITAVVRQQARTRRANRPETL